MASPPSTDPSLPSLVASLEDPPLPSLVAPLEDPELLGLVASLEDLPPVARRAVCAMVGAAVADAAARPLHWVYNVQDMDKVLEEAKDRLGNDNVEFWPENKSPFYSLPTGARSGYNHAMEAGLVAVHSGVHGIKEEIARRFGQGTEWQAALNERKEAYTPAKRRVWRNAPVVGPWLHGAIIYQLEHGSPDPNNTEMDSFLLSLPYIAVNAAKEDVLQEAGDIWRILTSSKKTLEWNMAMGELLRKVILGHGWSEEWINGSCLGPGGECLEDLEELAETKHRKAAQFMGNNCHLPGSFQGAVHAALTLPSYELAVRATISAGGCNCSRANYLGALLAARDGIQAIPTQWIHKTTDAKTLLKLALSAVNL